MIRRHIYTFLLCAIAAFSYGQAATDNYVLTETFLDSQGSFWTKDVQYFDGLGRPSVLAEKGNAPFPYDRTLYTHTSYDTKGRTSSTTLKAIGGNSTNYCTWTQISSFLQNTYSDSHALSTTTYDALDRPTFISTPGDAWSGKGHAIEYVTNTANSVRRYRVRSDISLAPATDGYYPEGSLTGERHTDEDGVSVTTYKDLLGRTVLERRGTGDDTYYVYNTRGQLRFILSPMYQENGAGTNLAYYLYDGRGRLTSKRAFCGSSTQYTYDTDNRILTIQDPRLRAAGRYRFFVYDGLGRTVIQGTCSGWDSTPAAPVYARRNGSVGYDFCGTGYFVSQDFQPANPVLEIVNYYDDYAFLNSTLWTGQAPDYDFSSTNAACTATLPTGSITATSDGHYLFRVQYYDERGRVTDSRQSLLDGSFLQTATTYNFLNKPLTVQTTLQDGNNAYTVDESLSYDQVSSGKLLSQTLSYGDTTACIGEFTYNSLGQLTATRKHDQHVSTAYTYNLHGWPTSVNTTKTYGNYSTLFKQDLYYETGQGTPCYNGNISSMRWRWNNSNSGHGFTFAYDSRDRLTSANHTLYNMSAYPILYSEQMTYNRNSAITSLTRTGNGASNNGNMDVLVYSYAGNKLQYIYDYGVSNIFDGIFEFVTNTIPTSGTRYTYNSAGDLTQDANKGLSLIDYDLLGHPRRIQHHNGNVTEYVYAATGEKLRVKHTTAVEGLSVPLGQTLELTDAQTMDVDSVDYWGKWQLTKEDIVNHHGVVGLTYQFGGGYFAVMPKRYRPPHSVAVGIQYIPSFFYYVTDYQGNVRLVVDGNGAMAQRNDYYAYGGPWGDNAITQGFQPFKYNGKELDRMHGLDWYDYGARMYDPAMGLFTQVDPLAEQYPHLNPYQYCAGNPVKYVDPDGMKPRRREALAMADDVYDPGKKDLPGGWTWIDTKAWGLALPNNNGFMSAIYGRKNKNGGFSEYVYATAGTDPTSLEDWKQNIKQISGKSEQYRQSVEAAVKIKSILRDQELTYLGHSLGGGLASANALKTGDPAITFNAAGLSKQTKLALQLNKNADITAYVISGEIVSKSQALVGLRPEGRISFLPSVPLGIFPSFSRPAISIVYHTMAYLKWVSNLIKDE